MSSGIRANAFGSDAQFDDDRRLRLKLAIVRAIAIVVFAISLTALGGRLFGVDALSRLVPPPDRLALNAACAFMLLGILLALAAASVHSSAVARPTSGQRSLWVRVLAVLVALFGFATLLEHLVGARFSLDAVLAGNSPESRPHYEARMSVVSAVSLIVLGGVFFIRTVRPRAQLASLLALIAFLFGYVALLGYVYDAEQLYRIGPIAIPLESAACIVLIASGCLLLPPYSRFMRPVVSRSAGGVLLRRLLPVALFVAPAVDWV